MSLSSKPKISVQKKVRPIVILESDDARYDRMINALRGIGVKNTILRVRSKDAGIGLLQNRGEFEGLTDHLPGIIFLNIQDGPEDALDFCTYVKQFFTPIPIIGMADKRDKELMDSCYTTGMNAVIVLPDNMEKFYQSLFRTLHFWYRTAKMS